MPESGAGDPMTARQEQVWRWMLEFQERCTFPPTIAQVSVAMGCKNPNGVETQLRALLKKGYIVVKEPRSHRRYVAVRP